MARLAFPIRVVAFLVVVAPIAGLLPDVTPLLWDDPAWRLTAATALSGALLLPTVGALVLAFLAVRDGTPSSGFAAQALATAGVLTLIAGVATGILVRELLAGGDPLPATRVALVRDAVHALLLAIANAGIGWGVLRPGRLRGLAFPTLEPPRAGIDLLN